MSVDYFSAQTSRHIGLRADRRSAKRARAFTQTTLTEWGLPQLTDDVTLTVSELITNAVVHAKTKMILTLVDLGDELQIRVQDEAPARPHMHAVTNESTGGRGLHIIETVSNKWGVEESPPGKTVWVGIAKLPPR